MKFFDKILKKEDKIVDVDIDELVVESGNRLAKISPRIQNIVTVIAILWSVFQIYTGFFGLLPALLQRSLTLGFGMVLTFVVFRFKKEDDNKVRIYDYIMVFLSAASVFYLWYSFESLVVRGGLPTQMDVIMGVIMVILLLEATRRSVGLPLVIVAVFFLLYAFIGPYLPGLLGHRGYSIARVAGHMYITNEGIFGIPMSVMTTFVYAFVLFGCFLEATGGAKLFIDLAYAIAGRFPGGPAKTAVLASGFLGTISGSSLANVVTTGSFTIPLMKESGYDGSFAGGVEASASSAGQIMPPVMGSAAFIMAETTGISYLTICLAAAIPAVLYYASVLLTVDLEARRLNLKSTPADELPKVSTALKNSIPLLLPITVIVGLLVMGYTPLRAALYSTIVMLISSSFSKKTRLTPKLFLQTLERTAHNAISVTIACGVCGIITGVITLTGIGLKLSDLILTVSGGNLLATLLLTMVASIILGMGLPTTAKYIVLSAIAAPALTTLGVPLIGAHLFILYFGVLAEVTPPVALTSYAGAAIAQAPGMKTAMQGLKISIAAFFIPFMFVYYPELMFVDLSFWGLFQGLISSSIGVICLASSSIGYLFGNLSKLQRVLLFSGAILVLSPSLLTDTLGIAIITITILIQRSKSKTLQNSH